MDLGGQAVTERGTSFRERRRLGGIRVSLVNPEATQLLPGLPRGDDAIVGASDQHHSAHTKEVLPPGCGEKSRQCRPAGGRGHSGQKGRSGSPGPHQWHWDGLSPR